MTRMVARVSRWWYSRCYESAVLAREHGVGAAGGAADLSASIWADEELLGECERRGTTLRLMVCFAQKPECAVRRTISDVRMCRLAWIPHFHESLLRS